MPFPRVGLLSASTSAALVAAAAVAVLAATLGSSLQAAFATSPLAVSMAIAAVATLLWLILRQLILCLQSAAPDEDSGSEPEANGASPPAAAATETNPWITRIAWAISLAALYLLYCDLFAPLHPPYQLPEQVPTHLPDVLVELSLPAVRTNSQLLGQGGCEYEPNLRSNPSPTKVQITFVNQGNQPVGLNWIDYRGQRQLAKLLAPGEHHVQQTFANHPWVLTNDQGACQTILVVQAPQRGKQT